MIAKSGACCVTKPARWCASPASVTLSYHTAASDRSTRGKPQGKF